MHREIQLLCSSFAEFILFAESDCLVNSWPRRSTTHDSMQPAPRIDSLPKAWCYITGGSPAALGLPQQGVYHTRVNDTLLSQVKLADRNDNKMYPANQSSVKQPARRARDLSRYLRCTSKFNDDFCCGKRQEITSHTKTKTIPATKPCRFPKRFQHKHKFQCRFCCLPGSEVKNRWSLIWWQNLFQANFFRISQLWGCVRKTEPKKDRKKN